MSRALLGGPYCSEEGCHDTRTNTYSVQMGPTTFSSSPHSHPLTGLRTVYVNYPWGERLCRIHAMLRNRFALGGAA